MIRFSAKKLLVFQENLSDSLNVYIGMFNSVTGDYLPCRCSMLKDEPELFHRNCLPFFRNCSKNADLEIRYQTCPLGLNHSYSLIQGQPLILFVGSQSKQTEGFSHKEDLYSDLLAKGKSKKDITDYFNDLPSFNFSSHMDKTRTVKNLLQLYASAIYNSDRFGMDSLQLRAVREIGVLITSLLNSDQFEIMKIIDLILGFTLIVMNADGAWAIISLADGSRVFLNKGDTKGFSQLINSKSLEEIYNEAIEEDIQCAGLLKNGCRVEIIKSGSGLWGIFGIEGAAEDTSDLLHLFNSQLQIALEIDRLCYNISCQLGNVLNSIPAGILILNEEQKVYYSNDLACKLLNNSKENIFNRSLNNLFGINFTPFLSSGKEHEPEGLFNLEFAKESNHFSFSFFEIRDKKNVSTGSMFIFKDITEEKFLKNKLQRIDSLSVASHLAAGVVHEVRNPLTAAKGFLQMISQKSSEIKIRNYAEIVLEELEQINKIITDFLKLAKPAEPLKIATDPGKILLSLENIIYSEAVMQNTSLQFNIQDNLPLVELDSNQIKQVILNLAKNSIQAIKDDGRLEISCSSNYGSVFIRITDNGEGIKPSVLENIFNPFFTTKESGTGMGLAVCKNIILLHNGKIEVFSPVSRGRGTMVEIELPVYINA